MTDANQRPFLGWPGWRHLGFTWLLSTIVTAWFAVVFTATNSFTASRTTRVRVHLDAELQIPLIPAFTIFYMSIYLLFAAAPFVLRTRREIVRLAIAQSLAIFIAGIFFLLIPAPLAYAPPTDLGVWQNLFQFADNLNLDYNLVPSLHVALSFVCIGFFAQHASVSGKVLLRSWGWLIAASTILTHQHHLLDAVTGWLLALAVVKLAHRIEKLFWPSELSTSPSRYSA
jgi:membrane-associated phospholipid phosphatase